MCEIAPFTQTWQFHRLSVRIDEGREKTMFGRNKERYILELSQEEARLLKAAMIFFHNWAIERGKPQEDIEEILVKLYKAH